MSPCHKENVGSQHPKALLENNVDMILVFCEGLDRPRPTDCMNQEPGGSHSDLGRPGIPGTCFGWLKHLSHYWVICLGAFTSLPRLTLKAMAQISALTL